MTTLSNHTAHKAQIWLSETLFETIKSEPNENVQSNIEDRRSPGDKKPVQRINRNHTGGNQITKRKKY
jgi:hypothetical protein